MYYGSVIAGSRRTLLRMQHRAVFLPQSADMPQ